MNLYFIEIEIEGLPKTINEIGRKHWAVKKKEVDKWHQLVAMHTLGKRPMKPLKHAKVTMIRHSSKEPDFDNLASSFKAVMDGLIKAGVIENDRQANIGQPSYRWEKAPHGAGHIWVRVEELGEENSAA